MNALDDLREALHEAAEPDRVSQLQRFFKTAPGEYGEGDVLIGVRVPQSRRLARRFAERVELSDPVALLESHVHEERLVALLILVHRYERGDEPERERIFKLYLANTKHVNSWDLVDTSAPQIVGAHLLERPRELLDELARSDLVWERRIAMLATFAFIRAGEFEDTQRIARALPHDDHDLIHKAVGWMLREVGKRDEGQLLTFLDQHGAEMPSTMRRYATERLGPRHNYGPA
jgi:3-methyladenine DNA glycosylase AlkD